MCEGQTMDTNFNLFHTSNDSLNKVYEFQVSPSFIKQEYMWFTQGVQQARRAAGENACRAHSSSPSFGTVLFSDPKGSPLTFVSATFHSLFL